MREFLDGGRLDLHPGDLILLPRGTPHLLRSDSPAQPCEPTVEHRGSIPLYQLNGPGEALDMLCGSYRYHAGASLFGALPERLLVHMDESTQQPLRALIGLMREEAESTRSGARSIIDALATALFALALRAYLDRQPLGHGLFGLLGDARLGRALRAMLERPEHAWTLEQLAQQAAMSRASFVRAFSALGGTSPWNLLTRIRMEKARGLLRQTQKSLLDIAAETGYQSEAAFSRNFRQAFGESPGRFRRQADSAR